MPSIIGVVIVSSNKTPIITTAPNGYERMIGYWSGKSAKWRVQMWHGYQQ